VSESPLLSTLVGINFLHFAIVLFVVSVVLLVTVSLATAPESMAKLRGLTFATLDQDYRPRGRDARSVFTLQIVATVVLALFTIGLWVHFA
jgi:SSS family solute:Na+ symporter